LPPTSSSVWFRDDDPVNQEATRVLLDQVEAGEPVVATLVTSGAGAVAHRGDRPPHE